MGRSKIQNEQELLRWFEEGRTYGWMKQKYLEKYNIEVGETMFANFRRRRGIKPRLVHDDTLIPWKDVPDKWRWTYPISMLRIEARRRAGDELTPDDAERLEAWKRQRKLRDEVVAYLPDHPDQKGFYYVPRRPGIDNDLIREPD